ncbi:MAG: protein kinase [Myxococcaceae bacterium]
MTTPSTQTRLRPFKPAPFGRYTLLMPVATGGMGEIYLARLDGAEGFEKLCVIKKILPHLAQDKEFIGRFVNEAKTLGKLSHGAIAQVLDMGLTDEEPYLALEYVDGKDLRRVAARMRERNMPLPLTFALYVISRVLDALAYAHRKRDDEEKEMMLVHRDVSPQNILISYEGEVKVIDFGLAKSTLNSAKTNPSIVLGKFLYMSPEQARHAKVDRRSDLYSVGICLWELVAGKNPFDGIPPAELMGKVANPTLANIQQVEPLCPTTVAQLITKALSTDPAQRFQTAEEFRGKVQSALLDIDPSAGPESVSRFMREAFSAEFQMERKLLASFRESKPQPAPPPSPPDADAAKREPPTAVRNLADIARRSMEIPDTGERPALRPQPSPINPAPLSFSPTPRLKPGFQMSEPDADRETKPGKDAPPRPLATNAGTTPAPKAQLATDQSMPQLDEADASPPVITGKMLEGTRKPSPWGAGEVTMPEASPLRAQVVTHPEVPEAPVVVDPSLMDVPPTDVEPAAGKPLPVGQRSTKPGAKALEEGENKVPVVAPLPAALKGRPPPVETTGETSRTRISGSTLKWLVVPLLVLLGVAGWIVYGIVEEQQEAMEDSPRSPSLLQRKGDGKSREVAPPVIAPSVPEPEAEDLAVPTPAPAKPSPPPKAEPSP